MTEEKQERGDMGSDLFTIGEAVKYLGVARNTILLYALKERLPYITTAGGVQLFKRQDLDAILPSVERNRRLPAEKKRTDDAR